MKIDLNRHIYPFLFKLFRPQRMQRFRQTFQPGPRIRILDVGGTPYNWTLLAEKPELTILNISLPKNREPAGHTWLVADGRYLPFKSGAFEIVYSNSVIEHLGDYASQERFAGECRRVGQAYFIQTPHKWFPIEPHYLAAFVHWLPVRLQRRLLPFFSLRGWLHPEARAEIETMLAEIRLLTVGEMRALFPEARLIRERLAGLTKSLIVVCPPSQPSRENQNEP